MNRFDRRTLLRALALGPAVAAIPHSLRAQAAAAGLISGDVCLVQPETTEGPYYLDTGLVRADITEGRAGLPMLLRLQVVTADCTPITGARVDLWQCDAAGVYAGVQGDTGTFLRGTQMTGADGVAAFGTIFPGWYPGRVVHVHYKVFLPGGAEVLTAQVFFDDDVATAVHTGHPAYMARGAQDRSLAADRIAQGAGRGAVAEVRLGEVAEAALVVGVDDTGQSGGLWQRLFGQG
jgi:protocatechuate 3,4-dioxygenase beta subunit